LLLNEHYNIRGLYFEVILASFGLLYLLSLEIMEDTQMSRPTASRLDRILGRLQERVKEQEAILEKARSPVSHFGQECSYAVASCIYE
jgi:hypothetical protein